MKARCEEFFESFSLAQRVAMYLVCAIAVLFTEVLVVLR